MSLEQTHPNADQAYAKLSRQVAEIDHAYGENVHILADVFLLTHLAFLCSENTQQPAINSVVRDLYQYLIRAVLNHAFPRKVTSVRTRMHKIDPRGIWTGEILDPDVKTVSVSVLRAGSLPSQVCFDFLNKTLNPKFVRQDHVIMARMVNEEGHVIGSHLGDSKIGGPIDDAIVLFPDPMGATGSSLSELITFYKTKVPGKAKKFIAVNLIVTPEYISLLKEAHPDLSIYALRLDRGASPADVLAKMPGTALDRESGLSDKQYILPGGGGFGEIMNNAYV